MTAHLATSQALLGLLIYILVRTYFPARIGGRGSSQRFTLLAAFGAAATYALLLFGARVTATDAALIFPDWPLMGGTFFPALTDLTTDPCPPSLDRGGRRADRGGDRDRCPAHPAPASGVVRLAVAAAVVYVVQAIVGGLQVLTQLAVWTQTLHVALGATVWALTCALAVTAYYTARVSPAIGASDPRDGLAGRRHRSANRPASGPHRAGDTLRAYVALTKPRIIELLLVTTVPAMVLAARDVPGLAIGELELARRVDAGRRFAGRG